MATLADELLNDFEESDSENESKNIPHDGNVADGDDELDVDRITPLADLDEGGDQLQSDAAVSQMAIVEDQEQDDTKASIERMQFSGVRDVRSVARLMKTLQPILEVCAKRTISRTSFFYKKWFANRKC